MYVVFNSSSYCVQNSRIVEKYKKLKERKQKKTEGERMSINGYHVPYVFELFFDSCSDPILCVYCVRGAHIRRHEMT